MVDFFQNFNPITQAFLATLFTWGMTRIRGKSRFCYKNDQSATIG